MILSAEGSGPECIARGICLDEIDISGPCTKGIREACDDVTAIRSLSDGVALIISSSTIGSGPERVALGVGLDEIDIMPPAPKELV